VIGMSSQNAMTRSARESPLRSHGSRFRIFGEVMPLADFGFAPMPLRPNVHFSVY
jgi:hypothetical protein